MHACKHIGRCGLHQTSVQRCAFCAPPRSHGTQCGERNLMRTLSQWCQSHNWKLQTARTCVVRTHTPCLPYTATAARACVSQRLLEVTQLSVRRTAAISLPYQRCRRTQVHPQHLTHPHPFRFFSATPPPTQPTPAPNPLQITPHTQVGLHCCNQPSRHTLQPSLDAWLPARRRAQQKLCAAQH